MSQRLPRSIQVVHASPGRTRLRLQWLRGERQEATALADALADLAGMQEVAIRPWTGSVLCQYDAGRLDQNHILAVVNRYLRTNGKRHRATATPPQETALGPGVRANSTIAAALTSTFKNLDSDLLAITGGRLDLGTLATLGFLFAGAAEVATTRRLPAPPWFNLAWWAFRTFTEFERPANPAPTPPRATVVSIARARRNARRPATLRRHQPAEA